jgi:hypothetical protein
MSKLPPFKLRLLSGQFVDTMRKPRHKNMFEVVTLSTHLAYVLGSDRLNTILRPKATVLVETVKFLCEVRSELRRNYAAKQRQFADRLGWTLRDAQASDGVEHAALAFSFDADTAPANAERAIAEQKAAAEAGGAKKVDEGEAGLPQLMPPAEEAEASAEPLTPSDAQQFHRHQAVSSPWRSPAGCRARGRPNRGTGCGPTLFASSKRRRRATRALRVRCQS